MESNNFISEEELIHAAQANRKAFLHIYDKHFKQIYNYVYYRTFNISVTEEITSQTFLKALENIKNFEYRKVPIIVWLYRIASNNLVDFYRNKDQQTVELTEDFPAVDSEASPEEVVVKKTEKEQLISQLKTIPSSQQQAIVLRYLQGLSYKDIAQILDKTEGSIKQLLYRGLQNLRERMMHHE